jgi:hypothetical protein
MQSDTEGLGVWWQQCLSSRCWALGSIPNSKKGKEKKGREGGKEEGRKETFTTKEIIDTAKNKKY